MKFHDVVQGSDDWLELRRGIPSASRFDMILTPKTRKPSASQARLIAELIGESFAVIGPPYAENYTNKAIRWGQQTEEEARRFYCMDRDTSVSNGGWCLTDCGRFGASPDGLVAEDGCLELKCPQPTQHSEYLLGEPVVPSDYLCQCHGQLIVTGRKWVDFLSYCPGLPPFLVRLEPDEFTECLKAALEEFWKKYQVAVQKIRGKS